MKRWLRTGQLARARQKHASGAGYTVLETMIVLAVTTAMFAAIVVVFAGRQAKTEFTRAVRDFEGKLQSSIDEVVNGYYTSYTCSSIGSNPPTVSTVPSTTAASNVECIFVGKALQVDPLDKKSTNIHTLVGRRTLNALDDRDVESIYEAKPVISTAADVSYTHSYQLEVRNMVRISTNDTVSAIGFIRSFARNLSSPSGGSADVAKLYGLTGVSSLVSGGAVDLVNFQPLSDGVKICLKGANDQRAEITVGADGNPTSIFSTLGTDVTAACNV